MICGRLATATTITVLLCIRRIMAAYPTGRVPRSGMHPDLLRGLISCTAEKAL